MEIDLGADVNKLVWLSETNPVFGVRNVNLLILMIISTGNW